MRFGVVGLGSFGVFFAEKLKEFGQVCAFSEQPLDIDGVTPRGSLKELVVSSDVIILAVPLESYDKISVEFLELGVDLSSKLVVDVASVKVTSQQLLIDKLGGSTQLLISHPLFGPESAANGLGGHTFIVTHQAGEQADNLIELLEVRAGLTINRMSAEEHDRSMAYAHALTFFVGRTLNSMELERLSVTTPSFQKLLAVAKIDSKHSTDLFETIVEGNPYAGEVIDEFIERAQQLR